MSYIKSLTGLMVGACNKFERFVGDNSSVTWAIIDGCRLFDMQSIASLPNAESIAIIKCAKEITISELPEHPKLTSFKLWAHNLNFDMYDFKKKFPNLNKLSIAKVKKADRELLRQANPDVDIFI
jgi:hypothetical protein